jgi:hypothetical protein
MIRVFGAMVLLLAVCVPARGQSRPRPQGGSRSATTSASTLPSTSSSPSPHPLYQPTMTWYEFMLHELNPHDRDLGAWYKRRREALVDASLRNPYFWYSYWVSLAFIIVAAALIKSLYDRRRMKRIMGEQMDEVRAHDAYSRQAAHEAIRRYNEHIELCNRAIEASDAGQATALGGSLPVASLKAELDAEKMKVSGLESDKRRLEVEVAQKGALITDLSLRINALSNQDGNGHGSDTANSPKASDPELVRHISSLQQQLYAEREKNKRLKGGL